MTLIVSGVDKGGAITLVSTADTKGILHQGSYLTVEDGDKKFIVRVEDTAQINPYNPSPLIVDMDLGPLIQDQKSQNYIVASRVTEIPDRDDGMSSFIKPQLKARRSNQDEIDAAFGNREGVPVFPATVFSRSVQHLYDDDGRFMQAKLPDEVFFHQMLIAGRTGSGKTVAMKYLAQYFIDTLGGAVIAVNVKEEDMLTMDQASETQDPKILKEWADLGVQPRGVDTFRVYYPGNKPPRYSEAVDLRKCEMITLQTQHIDPETLSGLIQNISGLGADQLPAIFRYWQEKSMGEGETIGDFVAYFSDPKKDRFYTALNTRGEELPVKMHPGTFQNVRNALSYATEYFDVPGAKELQADDIIQPRKMSVIDVAAKGGFGFGAVLLRDLLEKIYEAKSLKELDAPVLIIIDEVHEFYGTAGSREALDVLDSICRKGRSLEIAVIFASQNPEDMPKGINSVVNSKIYFKSDAGNIRSLVGNVAGFDPEAFKAGYGVARIHGLNQLKYVKFPMSLAGVRDESS